MIRLSRMLHDKADESQLHDLQAALQNAMGNLQRMEQASEPTGYDTILSTRRLCMSCNQPLPVNHPDAQKDPKETLLTSSATRAIRVPGESRRRGSAHRRELDPGLAQVGMLSDSVASLPARLSSEGEHSLELTGVGLQAGPAGGSFGHLPHHGGRSGAGAVLPPLSGDEERWAAYGSLPPDGFEDSPGPAEEPGFKGPSSSVLMGSSLDERGSVSEGWQTGRGSAMGASGPTGGEASDAQLRSIGPSGNASHRRRGQRGDGRASGTPQRGGVLAPIEGGAHRGRPPMSWSNSKGRLPGDLRGPGRAHDSWQVSGVRAAKSGGEMAGGKGPMVVGGHGVSRPRTGGGAGAGRGGGGPGSRSSRPQTTAVQSRQARSKVVTLPLSRSGQQ